MGRLAVVVVLWGQVLFAADPALVKLRAALQATRRPIGSYSNERGGLPELTTAKHLLRDWVESRIAGLPLLGDIHTLAEKINAELRAAGFFCGENSGNILGCPERWSLHGVLNPIQLDRPAGGGYGVIALRTSLGIACGFDESAYLYRMQDSGAWERIWQSERNTYTDAGYLPQTLLPVRISNPYRESGDFSILTLGLGSWCSSNLLPVYYRVYRYGPGIDSTKPLIEEKLPAHHGVERPIQGSISADSATIQFYAWSLLAQNIVAYVRSFTWDKTGRVKRVDPIALTPREFVDEWLTIEAGKQGLERSKIGVASLTTMQCGEAMADLRQVEVGYGEKESRYFLIRWLPPYRFRMVEVRSTPSANCRVPDPESMREHTLFLP